jgi:hypothetical protein
VIFTACAQAAELVATAKTRIERTMCALKIFSLRCLRVRGLLNWAACALPSLMRLKRPVHCQQAQRLLAWACARDNVIVDHGMSTTCRPGMKLASHTA